MREGENEIVTCSLSGFTTGERVFCSTAKSSSLMWTVNLYGHMAGSQLSHD